MPKDNENMGRDVAQGMIDNAYDQDQRVETEREKGIQKVFKGLETKRSSFTDTEVETRWRKAEKIYDQMNKPRPALPAGVTEEELSPRDKAIQKVYDGLTSKRSSHTDTDVEARWAKAEKLYDKMEENQEEKYAIDENEKAEKGYKPNRRDGVLKVYDSMETPKSDWSDAGVKDRWRKAEKMYDKMNPQAPRDPEEEAVRKDGIKDIYNKK